MAQALRPEEVDQVSKWPSREEQLSILVGQILRAGANLVTQLTSVGDASASQIKQTGRRRRRRRRASGEAPWGSGPGRSICRGCPRSECTKRQVNTSGGVAHVERRTRIGVF